MHSDEMTVSKKKATQVERQRYRFQYSHLGYQICREFFLFIHCLKKDKLESLISHLKQHGVSPRIHKNKSKLPRHSLKFAEIRQVVSFIVNYSEQNAIILPGRHPRHWITDAQLLPTSCTKRSIYNMYKNAATENGFRDVSKSTFYNLWAQLVPFIRTMPPASDLCWRCQETTKKMQRSANRPDEKKITVCPRI